MDSSRSQITGFTVSPITELIRSLRYRVVEAADGAEAILAAERERPDLVILALNLPVLDGLEVARRLRGCSLRQTSAAAY